MTRVAADLLLSRNDAPGATGCSLSEIVCDADALLGHARDTLERDVEAARDLIDRAVALLRLHASPGPAAPGTGGLTAWQAERIVDHVRRNLSSPISLAELAAIVRLSPSQLSRAFKRRFGETPHAYVVRARLRLARHLMLTTAEPLSQIAAACGLADQAHLSRLFRREIGETPHAWRRARRSPPTGAASARRAAAS